MDINPFEEGCFHDDRRTSTRQAYHSCGQFNNILASLLQVNPNPNRDSP